MFGNKAFRRPSLHGLLILLGWCLAFPTMAATVPGLQPNPALTAADVVRIQLMALRHNDEPYPDAGIATVYAFAAPRNRQLYGNLSRFSRMIHAGYAPMIGNLKFILGKSESKQALTLQQVTVIASDGLSYQYMFVLSRQEDAPYENCWMTDSVLTKGDGKGAGMAV